MRLLRCAKCGGIVEDAGAQTKCKFCGATRSEIGFEEFTPAQPLMPVCSLDGLGYRLCGLFIWVISLLMAVGWIVRCILYFPCLKSLPGPKGIKVGVVIEWAIIMCVIVLGGYFLKTACHWMGSMTYLGLKKISLLKDMERREGDAKSEDAR